jgi:formylmethanofuran dehydrogenase subunit C
MIAFKGGKVFSMGEKGEINGGTIIIEGNLIQAVGKDLEIPEGCQVIDTTGKYITPGYRFYIKLSEPKIGFCFTIIPCNAYYRLQKDPPINP